MSTGLTAQSLRHAITSLGPIVTEAAPKLNELDTVLGDGDMGHTLELMFKAFEADAESLPDDLGLAFQKLALAIARTSGSSLSGVVMAALLDASRQTHRIASWPWPKLGALLRTATAAMIERGGGSLGDKSVMDSLQAIAHAVDGVEDSSLVAQRAQAAAEATLAAFRTRPSRIGRARLAGERSIGHDDPGMTAVTILVAALAHIARATPSAARRTPPLSAV